VSREKLQGLLRAVQEFEASLDAAEGDELAGRMVAMGDESSLNGAQVGGECPVCHAPMSEGDHSHGDA
jgi:hypothetical protein